jgi:hypothetical protein
MRLVGNYEVFCKLYDQGKVKPDVSSPLVYERVKFLRNQGWKIRGGLFWKSRMAKDLLAICRKSSENFEFALSPGGIDFWTE